MTLQYLDSSDLSLAEWEELLVEIAKAKPAAIYIDKIFGRPEKIGGEKFTKSIRELDVPVIAGGFVHEALTRTSGIINLDQRSEYIVPPSASVNLLRKLPKFSGYFYGPHQSVQPAFRTIGHILYTGDGRAAPLIRLGESVIPHLSLSLVPHQLTDDGLMIAGNRIDLDHKGKLAINMVPPRDFAKVSVSLKSALMRVRAARPFSEVIKEGQTILILPGMFTGNSDFAQTPIGYIPGGYVVASILNSALTGQWLSDSSIDFFLVFLLVFLGGCVARLESPVAWLASVLSGSVLMIGLSISLFIVWGVISNWPLLILSFGLPSLVLFSIFWQRRARQYRDELILKKNMQQAAVAVQDSLFHDKALLRGPCTFAASHHAADSLGGDWYGFYEFVDRGQAYFLIGDVTGHGFSSALLVGAVAGAINATLTSLVGQGCAVPVCLETLAQRVNLVVLETGYRIQKSMTMAFVGLDLANNRGYLLNCAHTPISVKNGKSLRTIAVGGELLGVAANLPISLREWDLMEGDIIFAYTDGLLENCGPQGERLRRIDVRKLILSADTPNDLVANVRRSISHTWQLEPLKDDCSFCAVALGKKVA